MPWSILRRRTSIWCRRELGGWRWPWRDGRRCRRGGTGLLRCRRRARSRCGWRDRAQGRLLRVGSRALRDRGIEWLEGGWRRRRGRRRPGPCRRWSPWRGRLVADMLLVPLESHPLAVRHLPQVDPASAMPARSGVAGHRPPVQSGVPPMVASLQAVVIICRAGCREAFFGVAPICELVDCATRRGI